MKNLNVKLAENFEVKFEDSEISPNDNHNNSEIVKRVEKFFTDLVKKNVFPEKYDQIGIDSEDLFIIFNEATFQYLFNNNSELETLNIYDTCINM